MKDLFDKIGKYVKEINIFTRIQKERFIVKFDEDSINYLKDICKIPLEENILMVLDDSYFKNLENIVVFTDQKIYWNIKNASMKAKNENTEININGKGVINNKLLNNVSIFSKTEKNIKIIYIISGTIQLIIPFINFEIENSLTLAFYDYITNHCGGYVPDNTKNEAIFKTISKKKNIIRTNIFAKIFNGISYIITLNPYKKPANSLWCKELWQKQGNPLG
jgi:hypothetical protein